MQQFLSALVSILPMADVAKLRKEMIAMVRKITEFPKPLIAAVHGYALGGGFELALACDIIIADETAVFGLTETSLGIIPGAGGTQALPRRIGVGRAKELIFTARTIDAKEALRIGLVNHLVPLEQLESTVAEMAAAIAANSPAAVMESKRVIDIATFSREAVQHEVEANIELRKSEEHRERFRAAATRVTGDK